MFSKYESSTARDVTHALVENSTLSSSFPNLATLAKIVPFTSGGSNCREELQQVKTRLRSQLGDDTLNQTIRVCIEGPERLTDESLEAIIEHWKEQKPRRLIVSHKISKTFLISLNIFCKFTIYI